MIAPREGGGFASYHKHECSISGEDIADGELRAIPVSSATLFDSRFADDAALHMRKVH